jgi:antitoxin MazE
MQTELSRWGNSVAVRLPKQALIKAGVKEGDILEIAVADDGEIRLSAARPKLTLDSLVSKITKTNRHHETEWGPARGRELW